MSNQTIITVEELKTNSQFLLFPYELSQEGLFIQNKDKKTDEITLQKLSEPIFVKETVQNLDTKEVTLILTYFFKGRYHDLAIGMGQLIPNEILKLSSKGVDVPYFAHRKISEFLINQQKEAPHLEVYRNVGWHLNKDQSVYFRHEHVHPKAFLPNAKNDVENGLYQLAPSGNLSYWLTMIQEDVVGNVQLEFILSAGFSSVLVGFLAKFYDDVDSLLIHLTGNSTQGKTTAALLAVSAFGMPSSKKGGLQKTWNGTANATINLISGNYGIPIIFDELSMTKAKSLTSEVYIITSGQEKARLNDQIKQREQGTWSTTMISTGEQSIFERTNQNIGLTVRAFELSNVSWTNSAEHADRIRRVIQDNYGHAGIAFLDYLFSNELSVIDELWEKWQEKCIEALEESPFRTRLAKKYAIILAAGELANDALNLQLDVEGILTFLVEQEKERMDSRDIGGKALRYMSQRIIQHQQNFKREGAFGSPLNCWGKFIIHESYLEVAILKDVLDEQLRLGGFDDPRVILRDWDDNKDLLITESDRRTKRIRIFEDDEQDQAIRKKMVSGSKKNAYDTTYNLKLDFDKDLNGLINKEIAPYLQEL